MNGGPGSGNFNPGQGRGIGKPASGSQKSELQTLTYSEDASNGPELIKTFLTYFREKHPELYNDESMNARFKLLFDEEDGVTLDDFITGKKVYRDGKEYDGGDKFLGKLSDVFMGDPTATGSAGNDFLNSMLIYTAGANEYGKNKGDRKKFDEKHGLSKFIDDNNDVHYSSDKTLYRGVSSTKSLAKKLKPGDKISMNGLSSWTEDEYTGKEFLNTSLVKRGKTKILFVDKTKGTRKAMINPFSSSNNKYGLDVGAENQFEVVYSGSAEFTVKNVKEEGDIYYVEVESK